MKKNFDELFDAYRNKLNEIEACTRTKVPKWKYMLIIIVAVVIGVGLFWDKSGIAGILTWSAGMVGLVIWSLIEKRDMKKSISENHIQYLEQRRVAIITVLNEFSIDYQENTESIDLLIGEAEKAQQREQEKTRQFRKLGKIFGRDIGIIGTVMAVPVEKLIGEITLKDIIIIGTYIIGIIMFMMITLDFIFIPLIEKNLKGNYIVYDKFMYDLRQLKIFSCDEDKESNEENSIANGNIEASELSVTFRANDLTNEDMETISVINRIALNSEVMGKLLKEANE